ncbi:tRNA wybutosine-synthesizing protein 2 homolog [Haliotis cracherodii]|uniref:tRNA wybutosine-synthesizing protein 2 homolog n=1 Tax=Haliotis cracherodii TaxID=6455 RepID=UPI0039EBB195
MTSALIVKKEETQTMRLKLQKFGFWDSKRRLKQLSAEYVAIPITVDALSWTDLGLHDRCPPCQVEEVDLAPSKTSRLEPPADSLKRHVARFLTDSGRVVSPELLADLPSHWEKHGDLILFSNSAFTSDVWSQLGSPLWKVVCQCLVGSRLARKSSISADGFRSPQVALLYGDNGWVEHVDNGIRYSYDVTRCMFSIGNITEKLRVGQMARKGETVVDLYAGIGYFTLPYLVHAGAGRVIACEWNPASVDALRRNLHLNRVQDRCTVYIGDNRQVCPVDVADRVNLGLIPSSEMGWPVACAALKADSGGILHIHGNVTSKHPACNNHDTDDLDHTVTEGGQGHPTFSVHKTAALMTQLNTACTCNNKHVGRCSENTQEGGGLIISSEIDRCHFEHSRSNSKHSNSNSKVKTKVDRRNVSCNKKLRPEWLSWSREVTVKINSLLEHGKNTWTVTILHIEHVKSYAPHIDHLVLDLDCRPNI